MNPATRELFRHNLLKQLDAVAPHSMPLAQLKVGAQIGGFTPTDAELDAELQYLADKGLVATAEKILSPENKRWRITADGRDHVAANPLA